MLVFQHKVSTLLLLVPGLITQGKLSLCGLIFVCRLSAESVASTMLCPNAGITKIIVEKKRVMGPFNIVSLIIVFFIFFLVGQTKMANVNEREKPRVAELLNLMVGLSQVMA